MLGILIGIASVILLTSIGEGTRVYILDQFTQFGTNLVAINPGRHRDDRDRRTRLARHHASAHAGGLRGA